MDASRGLWRRRRSRSPECWADKTHAFGAKQLLRQFVGEASQLFTLDSSWECRSRRFVLRICGSIWAADCGRREGRVVQHWRDLSVGRKVGAPYVVLTLLVGLLIAAVASLQLAGAGAVQSSAVAEVHVKGAQEFLLIVILGICAACLVLTAAAGRILSRSITHRMEGLIKATTEVARGNLNYRATVEASDEIGRLAMSFNQMVGVLSERTAQLQRLSDETVRALAAAIDARDPYTHGHSIRGAAYSQLLARKSGLDDADVEAIRRGCLVHDIGKIGVRDTVLLKPGQLSEGEQAAMREHPAVGYRMLQRLEWDQRVFDVVLHHHERWYGPG